MYYKNNQLKKIEITAKAAAVMSAVAIGGFGIAIFEALRLRKSIILLFKSQNDLLPKLEKSLEVGKELLSRVKLSEEVNEAESKEVDPVDERMMSEKEIDKKIESLMKIASESSGAPDKTDEKNGFLEEFFGDDML